MRSMLLIFGSVLIAVLCWGCYGPVLHWGQIGMATVPGQLARLRPFVCVGIAYFAIGVIVPTLWLKLHGEKGHWSITGVIWSLLGGTFGAIGALGIILAFNFGGQPIYVMPIVFGGAPVINAVITIFLAGKLKEIGPVFLAGLVMVLLGAVTVLVFAPRHSSPPQGVSLDAEAADNPPADAPVVAVVEKAQSSVLRFLAQILSIVAAVLSWGAYGPTLHKGQAAMDHSRLRAMLCVGIAYFAIAVVAANLILGASPEPSQYSFWGTFWSLAGGAAGAVGALGVILAFNFGGQPVFVMPLVFGGAPVVNTLFTAIALGVLGNVRPMFLAGLILAIAGSTMVLVFAPRGAPPKSSPAPNGPTEPVERPKLAERSPEQSTTPNESPPKSPGDYSI